MSRAQTTSEVNPSFSSDRKPVKERQSCHFYRSQRGCYNGQGCRFLHDGTISPHEENKRCVYYDKGYCSRGEQCWFKHINSADAGPSNSSNQGASSSSHDEIMEVVTCGICFEKPEKFGLLSGCSHAFCLTCLRDWRASSRKDLSLVHSNVIKTCPHCRAESNFITPSSRFFAEGDPRKQGVIDAYKASMAKVPCRYFVNSPTDKRFCPYGDDCFYKHEDENGQLHVFSSGATTLLPAFKERQARLTRQRARRRPFGDLLYGNPTRLRQIVEVLGRMYPEDSNTGTWAELYGDAATEWGDDEEDDEEDDEGDGEGLVWAVDDLVEGIEILEL